MDDELNKNDIIREGFTNLQLSEIWLRNDTKEVRKMGKVSIEYLLPPGLGLQIRIRPYEKCWD